jgi:hypothetical protein
MDDNVKPARILDEATEVIGDMLSEAFDVETSGRVSDCHGSSLHRSIMGEVEAALGAAHERAEAAERERDELRGLLATTLDAAVLPGHVIGPDDWKRACLLSGRWCAPFVPVGSVARTGGEDDTP